MQCKNPPFLNQNSESFQMDLIKKVRQFLADEKIDYLLVNATNEFLVEYSALSENARYFLTNFSGSTGDALISQDKIALFVDGRYHEQADQEVDKKLVKVVKMKLSQTFSECLAKEIKSSKTLAIVAQKNSQGRYEIFKRAMELKGIKIRLLDFDPVMKFIEQPETEKNTHKIEEVDISITGMTADEKLAAVAKNLHSNEGILITNLEEVSYLCNLRDFSKNCSSKIEGKCLVMKKEAVLFTNSPIKQFSKKFGILPLTEFKNFIENLAKIDLFFVDKLSISAYDYGILNEKVAFLETNVLKEMKSIKTKEEIAHYKKCFERTDAALGATRDFIENNENLSEYDIAKNLEENFYKFGAKSLSFNSIVAKDANSALAHYTKNSIDEIITEGASVLIDCGAYYEGGYATDCTRVFVKGTPSKVQKKIYTLVLKGFLAAFNKKITSKTSGYELDKAARKILTENAPKGFAFSHALGHGIGINVHEAPPNLGLATIAKTPIKPNMCFTIEPGLYKKGFGGVRLENSCYLEEDGTKMTIKSFANMCFEKKLIDYSLLTKREEKWLKAFEVK